jgi:hypothetical protein
MVVQQAREQRPHLGACPETGSIRHPQSHYNAYYKTLLLGPRASGMCSPKWPFLVSILNFSLPDLEIPYLKFSVALRLTGRSMLLSMETHLRRLNETKPAFSQLIEN